MMSTRLIQLLFLLGNISSLATAETRPQAIRLPFISTSKNSLTKRSDVHAVDLINGIENYIYAVNTTVGTPGQPIQFQLDTGSSDIWMFSPQACLQINGDAGCGGSFDESQSSTGRPAQYGTAFSIGYGDGSQVEGDYISDTVTIGDAVITGQTMAVAYTGKAPLPRGLMGIGFDTNEAILDQPGGKLFPSILDQMVSQNIIPAKAYSLYLDDYESATGSIIFGGYDASRYQGDMYVIPMVPDAPGGKVSDFNVLWTSFGITDAGGSKVIPSSSLPVPVLLDSGTAAIRIPEVLWKSLISYFRADIVDSDGYANVDCKFRQMQSSVDFGMGGPNGAIISVPFSEIIMPNRDGTCGLAAVPVTDPSDPFIFGDSILRSAYVVYDLDNKMIGMAPAVFDATDSNFAPFGPDGVLSVPNKVIPASVSQAPPMASSFVDGPTPTAPPPGEVSGTGPISGFTTSYTDRHLPTPQSEADSQKGTQSGANASVAFRSLSISLMALGGVMTMLL